MGADQTQWWTYISSIVHYDKWDYPYQHPGLCCLDTGKWYRVEGHIHFFRELTEQRGDEHEMTRVPTHTYFRIYDENGVLVKDTSDWTLGDPTSSYPVYTLQEWYDMGRYWWMEGVANSWYMGNNGPASASDSGPDWCVDYAAIEIRDDTWPGPVGGSGLPGQAGNPNPSNGAADVSADADLSWSAGSGTTSHDVYFGTDSTPDSGEFQGNQTATTFDPGTMSNNMTYYWRIDEVNTQGTTTGNVWSFTTVAAGAGTGLTGDYYDNIDFTSYVLTRVDATVNFNWGSGSPDPSIGADTFSVRWTGQVEPLYSETYTFYTTSDDGVRLWVDSQLVVDSWIDQGPTEHSGTIALTAGVKYDIQMDYYENGGGAVAELRWSSASQAKEIIPQSQLFDSAGPQPPGQASTPSPANSATDVTTTADLSWTAGTNATSHDVYFGTSSPGAFQGNQTATTFEPGTLTNDTTYYWRIDEVNAAGTTTGSVWNFTTEVGGSPPGQASNPSPPDSATSVSITADLSWTSGAGATAHDMYFGTTSPGDFQGYMTGSTYDPGTMSYDTTYYWRVYEFNEYGSNPGVVWSFTTEAASQPPAQATNPNPADSATGVSTTADLSWTAGSGATSHDVYFGTSSPGTFQGNQTATTFEPGTMTNITTYYWRIDEVNAQGTTTGNVWSFTTVAAGETIKINFQPAASQVPAGYEPDSGAVYGDRGNGLTYGWDATLNETRDRGVDTDQRYDTLNHMQPTGDYTWEIALANGTYDLWLVFGDPAYPDTINTMDVEGTVCTDPDGQDNFDEYNIQVGVTDGRLTISPAAGSSNSKICFIEITPPGATLPGQANNPSPPDTAADVSIEADLTWTAGSGATSHDVYFGTTSPGAFQGNQTETTFDPGTLSYGITYYWRIDEINAAGTTTGNVWNFTTEAAPLPPGQATNPGPADSATDVDVDTDLNWTAGTGSTSSDVYFGATSPGSFQGNQTATTFEPGTMANDTTYYWRIDEINAVGTTTGNVWSFTTIVAPPAQATSPNPSDSATDMSVDTDLTWTAGSGSTSSDVYFGTTSPGTFQGNQTATSFDPGTMANDTTYYWRIDEINAGGTTTGVVWSFTTIVAPPAQATNPSPADTATDVDIDADLSWTAGSGSTSSDVYFGTTSPGTFQGNQTATTFDSGTMANGATYYWRIDEVNAGGTTTGTVWSFTTIVAVPGQASSPSPADSAVDVSVDADLSWTAGSGSTSSDVYFGTTSPGTFQGNQTAATFDPGTMANDTTYYWRIDEINAGGTTTGSVWTFTTITSGQPVTKEFGDAVNTDYPGTIEDTYTRSGSDGDDNYFNSVFLCVYSWPADTIANTTIIQWDVSSIPTDAAVTEATLYLYQVDTGGDSSYDVPVHKIINLNPLVSACTWNTYDGVNPWTGGADGGQSDIAAAEDLQVLNTTNNEYKTWTVTNMVADWVATPANNYGMLVNSDDVASVDSWRYFASSDDSSASIRPKLIVTYTTGATAPGQASNPSPANSAADVSIDADLSWTAGTDSTSSDVYFGTTSPGTFQGNQTATTFDPGTMTNDTTYYWRIDEINAVGTTTGNVWSFTTEAAAVTIKINFQPAASQVPAGYEPDSGAVYGDRGNGLSYGWQTTSTQTRDRGVDSDQRYDTLNHFYTNTWEIGLDNGTYDVWVVFGDPVYPDMTNTMDVEGTVCTDPDGQDYFDEYNIQVSVTDGRLTIEPATGADNPKICFIEITN